MTLKEFYETIGENYEDVFSRFGDEAFLKRFVIKFLDDPCFSDLKTALSRRDTEAAFRAAHTLKGICLNLGFQDLYKESAAVTERLRECVKSESAPANSRVPMNLESRYQALIQKIRQLD